MPHHVLHALHEVVAGSGGSGKTGHSLAHISPARVGGDGEEHSLLRTVARTAASLGKQFGAGDHGEWLEIRICIQDIILFAICRLHVDKTRGLAVSHELDRAGGLTQLRVEGDGQLQEGEGVQAAVADPERPPHRVGLHGAGRALLAARAPLEPAVSGLQQPELRDVLGGGPLQVLVPLLLVVVVDAEHVLAPLLQHELAAVPEHELLVEAILGIIPHGLLLDTRAEGLCVVPGAVRVAAAVDIT